MQIATSISPLSEMQNGGDRAIIDIEQLQKEGAAYE
jgi:hypothetical protein